MNNKLPFRTRRAAALATVALLALPVAGVPLARGALAANDNAAAEQPLASAVSFAAVVEKARPAVVTITTEMAAPERVSSRGGPMPQTPFDEFFRQFFGENGPGGGNGMPQMRPQQRAMALGSGFIVSPDGVIVTNNHVVDGAQKITVTLDDGREFTGTVVGTDPKTDLAVVRIDATDLPTVAWGDSEALKVGDPILAIGNPFGVGTTATSGIVSARGRDLHSGPYDDFLQVDAAINHGNSGGPLLDVYGHVVGVNAAIYSPSGGNVGVGFAIPSDLAKVIVAKLVADGKVERGFLGVQLQPVTPDIADSLNLPNPHGALVAEIVPDSPAAKSGLRQGDVIIGYGVTEIDGPKDLSRVVADAKPGSREGLKVWRDGTEIDVIVDVGNMPAEKTASLDGNAPAMPGSTPGEEQVPELKLGLSDLTPEWRQQLGAPEDETGAVIASIDPASPAVEQGLREGDVVVSVNMTAVDSAAAAARAVREAEVDGRDNVLLLVARGDNHMFVALPIEKA